MRDSNTDALSFRLSNLWQQREPGTTKLEFMSRLPGVTSDQRVDTSPAYSWDPPGTKAHKSYYCTCVLCPETLLPTTKEQNERGIYGRIFEIFSREDSETWSAKY